MDVEAAVDKFCKLQEIMVCVKHAAVPYKVRIHVCRIIRGHEIMHINCMYGYHTYHRCPVNTEYMYHQLLI